MSADITLSRLTLGTATFGVAPGADDVRSLIDAALDAGVTVIDTASSYGDQPRFDRPGAPAAPDRVSAEELIGRTLGPRRDRVVVCTKVGERIFDGPDGHGLGRTHVRAALARSLRRLRTDHVDILHAHHPDPSVPVDDLLATFSELIAEGTILHYGISTYSAAQATSVACAAEEVEMP